MRILLAVPLLALLANSASAQFTCKPGLFIEVLPSQPRPGEIIVVKMTNFGPATYQVPTTCLFTSVHANNCGTPAIFNSSACGAGPFTLTPGSIFAGAWDQRTNGGALVAPGKYAFKVPITGMGECCVDVTIAACPTPGPIGVAGAGTGGIAPSLSAAGPVSVGQSVQIDIQNGLGGAPSLLLIGFAPSDVLVPFGSLYVDLAQPFLQLVLPLGGTPGSPGQGSLSLNGTIPNDAALATLEIYLQVLVADMGSTGFLSHTAGLEMYICP